MKSFAFFDADETLLSFKSMFVYKHFLTTQLDGIGPQSNQEHSLFMDTIYQMAKVKPRDEVNKYFYRSLAGFNYEELTLVALSWFQSFTSKDNIYIDKTVCFLNKLKSQNIEPVIVSGSSDFILQPFADDLSIKHILCSRLEVQKGLTTGNLLTYPIIGEGKKTAIANFCNIQNVKLENCYAIGDDWSDTPMLESVGHPYIVTNGNSKIRQLGLTKGWGVIETPQLPSHQI